VSKRDPKYLSAGPLRSTIHSVTITYANGSTVDALILSSQEGVVRAAVAGHDDVRIFKKVDGVWRAQDGQPVQLIYAWQKGNAAAPAQESHFICSKELGRQLISRLMNGSESRQGFPAPVFVFSGEKSRLRITVLHGQQRLAG
jgi:hypothetical protein